MINPAKKGEYKVFQIDVLTSVDSEKELRKVIFDKVGKNVVHFDLNFEVGYYEGNTWMSFPRNDEFKEKLCQVAKEGRYLWCYGNKEEEEENEDDAPPFAKQKKAVNSVEFRAETVDGIANELKKLEEPPLGSIWKQPQDRVKNPRQGTEAMTMAFTKLANSVIDLQGKLLQNLQLAHTMFEKSAITVDQFEKRRSSLLKQLDVLD